jgi:hypothetical protein
MDRVYYSKYLKYKNKYLQLKKLYGGKYNIINCNNNTITIQDDDKKIEIEKKELPKLLQIQDNPANNFFNINENNLSLQLTKNFFKMKTIRDDSCETFFKNNEIWTKKE